MDYNLLSIVAVDVAPPSLAASVAVTIGSGASVGGEAPAVAAAVEMGVAE